MKAFLLRFYNSIRAKWLRYRFIDKYGIRPEDVIACEKILSEYDRLVERQFEFNKLMIKRMEFENEIPDNKI